MRIVVHGLWHLGSVTAACLAEAGFLTIGLDPDTKVVHDLAGAVPPLYEPGLVDLVRRNVDAGRLLFSTDTSVVADANVVWVAFDTPVDDEDRADSGYVERQVESLFPYLRDGAVVLISSQLPVGSTRRLAESFARAADGRHVHFAYSPENLRLGKAIDVFQHPERIVVGTEDRAVLPPLADVLGRFSGTVSWMSLESAEMIKHALNAFLATSVTFINEIASVAEKVGARASEVEEGLKSEARIGRKAYLKPGAAFAGGTLARDVIFLNGLADRHAVTTPLLSSIIASNAAHRQWPLRCIMDRYGDNLSGRTVAVFGLSYKPGTDALRRSASVEFCKALTNCGAEVRAFDPVVKSLPADLGAVKLCATTEEALRGAHAVVIATEWPEFRSVTPDVFKSMQTPFVVDQNGFLTCSLRAQAGIEHVILGDAR